MTAHMPASFVAFLTAFVLGTLIGAERQWRQRSAGLRTTVLVALGAPPISTMRPSGGDIAMSEVVKDAARILERMFDAIEFRGFTREDVVKLARYAGVPVYNGLIDVSHPTQTNQRTPVQQASPRHRRKM